MHLKPLKRNSRTTIDFRPIFNLYDYFEVVEKKKEIVGLCESDKQLHNIVVKMSMKLVIIIKLLWNWLSWLSKISASIIHLVVT